MLALWRVSFASGRPCPPRQQEGEKSESRQPCTQAKHLNNADPVGDRTEPSCSKLVGLPFRTGLQILEGALAIGRQADELAPEEVRTRLNTVQRNADLPELVSGSAMLCKFKAWLALAP